MKVNEVPEKLYFGERDEAIIDIYSTKEFDNEVEYTRTNAFIEKACKFFEPKVWTILLGCQKDTDEFMEDFKNYMKGE